MNISRERHLLHRVTGLLYILAGSMFILTLLELYGLKHWDGAQLIPWFLGVGGLIFLIASWFVRTPAFHRVARILMIVIALGGLFGIYEHAESNMEGDGNNEGGAVPLVAAQEAGENQTDVRAPANQSTWDKLVHGKNPALAPLAITGAAVTSIAAMAVLSATEEYDREQVERDTNVLR